jgi:hypothetical protein
MSDSRESDILKKILSGKNLAENCHRGIFKKFKQNGRKQNQPNRENKVA